MIKNVLCEKIKKQIQSNATLKTTYVSLYLSSPKAGNREGHSAHTQHAPETLSGHEFLPFLSAVVIFPHFQGGAGVNREMETSQGVFSRSKASREGLSIKGTWPQGNA